MINKINIQKKLNLFKDHWSPKVVSELNDHQIKLAKLKGEFIWHKHDNEDELFFVLKGKLIIEFRDHTVELNEQEFIVVPKGVEHRPVATEEVSVMLFEPATTLNTGDQIGDLTKTKLDHI